MDMKGRIVEPNDINMHVCRRSCLRQFKMNIERNRALLAIAHKAKSIS
jgi:hypothetical protein